MEESMPSYDPRMQLLMPDTGALQQRLLAWYDRHARRLPWRALPGRVWLSEIMLQQTTVATVGPYFEKFLAKWPRVEDLAAAPLDDVLTAWAGLGYYARARNLHKCARVLVEKHGGHFPAAEDALLELPGIGPYTSAAIASIAFDRPETVVDGNVFRVISRYLGIDTPINSSAGAKEFQRAADRLLDREFPGLHNQAIMEFGALQCTAKNPGCGDCPFSKTCYAHLHDRQHALPVKSKKPKSRNRTFHYIVIRDKEAIWMRKRKEGDIWSGLYDFMLVEHDGTGDFSDLRDRLPDLDFQLVQTSEWRRHILTHQNIHARFYVVEASVNARRMAADQYHLAPYTPREAADLPKPILIANFLNELRF